MNIYILGRPSKQKFFRIFLLWYDMHKTSTNLEFHESGPQKSDPARKNVIFRDFFISAGIALTKILCV